MCLSSLQHPQRNDASANYNIGFVAHLFAQAIALLLLSFHGSAGRDQRYPYGRALVVQGFVRLFVYIIGSI